VLAKRFRETVQALLQRINPGYQVLRRKGVERGFQPPQAGKCQQGENRCSNEETTSRTTSSSMGKLETLDAGIRP